MKPYIDEEGCCSSCGAELDLEGYYDTNESLTSNNTVMDVGELIELLEKVPTTVRVLMFSNGKHQPVSRLVHFGAYNIKNQEFNQNVEITEENQVYAICLFSEKDQPIK